MLWGGSSLVLIRLGRIPIVWQRLLLVAGCAVLFGVWLLWAPLTEDDEARFTEATRQMLVTHDYLIPHFNGEPRYQKPILYYWMQAASMRVFGVHESAARLPSAIAILLVVLLIHAFLLRWLVPREGTDPSREQAGRGAALLGAAALATMPLMAVWSRAAVADPTLTLFITGALLSLLQAELVSADGPAAARRWYLAAAACAALAFLTKGPVGVVLPAVVWVLYHLSRRTLRSTARAMPWIGGIGLFLLIAVPWYFATYMLDGPGFLRHFFMAENVGRFASTMEGHGMKNQLWGLFFYPLVSLLLLFPASAFLARDLIAPANEDSVPLDAGVFPRLRRFAWVWIAGVLAVFSLSRTQLPHYIQPIAGAAGILFALHLLSRFNASGLPTRRRRWANAAMLFLLSLAGVVWAGAPAVILWQGEAPESPLGALPFPPTIMPVIFILLLIFGSLFILGLIAVAMRKSPSLLVGWVMAAWTGLLAVLLLGFAPVFIRSQYDLSVEVGQYLSAFTPDTPILLYTRRSSESVVFYARHNIEFFSKARGKTAQKRAQAFGHFREKLDTLPSAVVVTDMPGLTELRAAYAVTILQTMDPCIIARITTPAHPPQPTAPPASPSRSRQIMHRLVYPFLRFSHATPQVRLQAAPRSENGQDTIEAFPANIALFRLINTHRHPWLDALCIALLPLGSGWLLIPIAASLTVFWRRRRLPVLLTAAAIETVLITLIKQLYSQPRPPILLTNVYLAERLGWHSFPSGDAAMAFMLAWTLKRDLPWTAQAGLMLYAMLIAYERIYLGAHFPLDVLAGAGVGILSALLAELIFKPKPAAQPVEEVEE